jgi:hypothetical protein
MVTVCEISSSLGDGNESQSSEMCCRGLNWIALGSLIALMMEAARTSEMSFDIQLKTWHYIPEDSELHGDSMLL